MQETQVWSLGQEDPLEKEMATLSNILAWEIPRTKEPDGLQSMGLQRFRHDYATNQLINNKNNWLHGSHKHFSVRILVSLPFCSLSS